MRFARVGAAGSEIPVLLTAESSERGYDLRPLTTDIDGSFLASGGMGRAAEAVVEGALPQLELRGQRMGPPIARPHAIYAIGLNYRDHAAETGMDLPSEPIVFSKAPNSLSGPADDIVFPADAHRGDWEAELGVVIGKRAHHVSDPREAAQSIAGYVAVNDVSERSWQLERGGQWLKGKSYPTFNPAGPVLVTPDEVGDVADLRLTLSVNGERMQQGSTADMIFDPHYLVWYLSQFVMLEAGDLINTGTPAGVGMGKTPARYLHDGDEITLSISGLGSQRNRVRMTA
ncbi:fumarylacetoacetate hydrolase family protein [Streptomyces sp. NBC_01314]|uniref:fumarylacetoacetate hydrolase family protein n=1 Tax=Streptomyces sp. NBC_01314 TaxID=2903821 RepID=UPI00308779FD|nr:fumarylacetoacetate hydrolase family protein [Streptomyces sp. NBC_01314]